MAQHCAHAWDQLGFQLGGPHHPGIVNPDRGVQNACNRGAEAESGGRSKQNPVTAVHNDPREQDYAERQKQLRLQGAQPQRSAGQDGPSPVQAQKQDQPQQHKERHLSGDQAGQCRRKREPNNIQPAHPSLMHGRNHAHRKPQ